MTTFDSRFALASRLAQFFRRNGDKIINGSCKLSLTTSALCLLNSLFIDILHQDLHTHLDISDCSFNEMQEDVKYLFDFMKRISSLKLFHGMQTLRGGVDLSHFSNLTVLELRKIPAHLIIGLNSLSIQLKALICSRSIYLLKELFGNTVDEQNTIDVWTELRELNLSYNYLENVDNSIRSIPHIEILDLSHNNLKNTDEIQALKRLKCVNLSYNRVESLPVFNSLSCRLLSKLYVRNNNLENLEGLECLFNLEEFDVGYNLLSEYSVLAPLDKLKSLKLLNLEGNPLYFHSQHLRLLCNYINPFALNRGLNLNGKLVAIPQNLVLHADQDNETSSGRHQTSINTVVGDMHNVHPPEINHHSLKYTLPVACIASDRNSLDDNSASSYTSQNSVEQAIATGTKSKKKQKKSKGNKGRVVVINEPEKQVDENILPEVVNNDSNIPSHMMVKEMFQTRREERGDSWLIPDNPFKKLGSDLIVPSNTPECRDLPNTASVLNNIHNLPSNKVINDKILKEFQKMENDSVIPANNELEEVLDIQSNKTADIETDRKRHISSQSDDIEILASNLDDTLDAKVLSAEDLSDYEFYKSSDFGNSTADGNVDDILCDSEDESEDSILFVERMDGLQKRTISLKIGALYAKERDVITGELIDKLDMSSLLSVDKKILEKDGIKNFELHLEFDTVKTSRQQRLYVFPDLESAERICKVLQPFADATALKEATIGAMECMNCKSQFSKQVAHRKVLKTKKPLYSKDVMSSSYDSSKEYVQEADVCPNCGNHIIVELESMPLPSIAAAPAHALENANITHSPGNSSLESSSSGYLFSNLFNSFKISPAPKRKSLAGTLNGNIDEGPTKASEAIGIYQSEKEYLKHRGSEAQISRNSSDVTITSNPSQSSIAVIPEPGMESNLNTIVEKDSQSSLSPPVSQSSTIYSNDKDHKNEDKHNKDNFLSSKDDPDFYSLTESFIEDKEQHFKCSDIMSSDSDVFHSPYKSVGSSNLQTSENLDCCDKLMQILGEKNIVTYDSFMQLDHRLKLHIEINIMGRDEHINSCLQTSIVPLSTGEEFDGVFLLSSKKVYVIKFLAQYTVALEKHESLEKQVQVLYSGPINQVKQIKVLLGNQGICVGCSPPTHVYTLVIRDVDVCTSFCNLISEQIQEKNPRFECLTSAEEMLQSLHESVLTSESEEKPEILLHQFAFKKDKDIVLPICVTLTKESVYLSKVFYKKQQSCPDLAKIQVYFFANSDHQKISDIISLNLEDCFTTVEVCFLIESSDVESVTWRIQMHTKSAMFSFINALKTPWEEVFAVPLPLTSSNE